jgi:hypothetical protein
VLALLITSVFGVAASSRQSQSVEASTLMGRLATVEPRARRISVVADDSADRIELLVDENSEILHESQDLPLSDLVMQVGSRVKIRYRMENGVRVALSITVERPPGG